MVGSFFEVKSEIWAFWAVQFMHILHLAIYDHFCPFLSKKTPKNWYFQYCKVASFNTSHFEAHAGIYWLLMKGIFNDYVLRYFYKKLISELVMRDFTVLCYLMKCWKYHRSGFFCRKHDPVYFQRVFGGSSIETGKFTAGLEWVIRS